MFEVNVGKVDRIFRVIAGVALVVGGFMVEGSVGIVVSVFGLIPLITGLSGRCPAYAMFHINTCPLKRV
ncbi:MAG: DUF2892 domain-containing protein [Candidatus Nitrohelix vancouverensis]|uniref:DUF2892 domain-containing protein n=1 Tax=Candidatus Nitrohelix vancouverensis TaxID=2705534 RepID=A0A7T0C2X2_9BACT|nr:MAG: DUF2892 domain-containing protein [Candidatus Nitrohelix vancouverensis]